MSAQPPHAERPAGDLWPFVQAELAPAYREVLAAWQDPPPGLWAALEARFRRGQADYGHTNEWLRWPPERFDAERWTEMLDEVLYTAMRRVVHRDAKPPEW